jgi:hypothetical protein
LTQMAGESPEAVSIDAVIIRNQNLHSSLPRFSLACWQRAGKLRQWVKCGRLLTKELE